MLTPKKSQLLFLLSLTIALSLSLPTRASVRPFAPDEVLPQFENIFQKEGVGAEPSEENFMNLQKFTQKLLTETKERLQSQNYAPFGKKWLERKSQFLSYSEISLQEATLHSLSPQAAAERFFLSKNIIYMLTAEEAADETIRLQGKNINESFHKTLEIILRILHRKRILHVKIPNLTKPLGEMRAQEESAFLVNSHDNNDNTDKMPETFITPSELAALTSQQVGDLDIPTSHPFWHSKKSLNHLLNHVKEQGKDKLDLWSENENFFSKMMTHKLNKKHKILVHHPNFAYDLTKSHRVLFFDEIKLSGTSAKINAKDSFDSKWKVKWSAEIQTEVIANRLLLKLGARYADPVYNTAAGAEGLTLILSPPSDKQNPEDCKPTTEKEFVGCLKKSRFKTDITPFILQSGVITEENASHVLRYLPAEALEEYQVKHLIGRTYLTFKEALVEFSPQDGLVRGGPLSWARFGAESDRVARSLLLFNSWINNTDPNESNNLGLLLPQGSLAGEGLPTINGQNFLSTQHDMGRSLDGILESGNPNRLKIFDFLYKDKDDSQIGFEYFLIYLPGAWKKATYADLLWMGEKITRITRGDLEEILSYTNWPDFMREAMVYKLLMRRNRIAQILNLNYLLLVEDKDIAPPSLDIPLWTVEERQAAALRYQLPYEEIEKDFQRSSHARQKNYHDKILSEGQVARCESTVLMRSLHRYRYPTGLDRRILISNIGASLGRRLKPCGGLIRVNLPFGLK